MRSAGSPEWIRLPGLFLALELREVIARDSAEEFRFEPRGYDERGAPLFAIYHRPQAAKEIEG